MNLRFMNLPVHPLAFRRVGYGRISSASQNLDGQTDTLTAAGCEKIFADTASGKLTERPELTLCLGYLRAGDTLVVWRLNRLGRSLRHLVETVNVLAGRGVAFASLHEGIDTTTSTGRLVFHIFAALAEFERELIAERAAVGRAAARARSGQPAKLSPEQTRLARAGKNVRATTGSARWPPPSRVGGCHGGRQFARRYGRARGADRLSGAWVLCRRRWRARADHPAISRREA